MGQKGQLSEDQFTCAGCGQTHAGSPRAFFVPEPLPWTDPRKAPTSILDAEQCRLDLPDGSHYYVRANLELPVEGQPDDPVVLTVWVSLSETSMTDMINRWDDADRAQAESYFGFLSNELPGYRGSYLIKCRVHTQPPGVRPLLELEPTDHLLSCHHHHGISAHQAAEISEAFLTEPADTPRRGLSNVASRVRAIVRRQVM